MSRSLQPILPFEPRTLAWDRRSYWRVFVLHEFQFSRVFGGAHDLFPLFSLDHGVVESRPPKPCLFVSKSVETNHELAQKLWKTGIHEARILASMIDDPTKVSEAQMEEWAADFDSWDVVDGCCGNLFDKTKFANRKANEWSVRKEEFVKRAGFVLMAELAIHNKEASNKTFLDFLPLIIREESDERNLVN